MKLKLNKIVDVLIKIKDDDFYFKNYAQQIIDSYTDEFAIGFGEYLDSLTAEDMGTLSIKELLEIYKKTL